MDVVCPWCYIGKRQFEQALALFPERDEVEVTIRSFELDPQAPARSELPAIEMLKQKYSMSEQQAREADNRVTGIAAQLGLEYHLLEAQGGNSFNAHRLVHLASTHGLAAAMEERLMAAYFTDSQPIGEVGTLERLAVEIGLDADEVAAVLAGDAFADEVRSDEQRAREIGVNGVPFYLFDNALAVAGAEPSDVLLRGLTQAWDRRI
jgi:predicted DsbA family dithiol-disulfide isomerase